MTATSPNAGDLEPLALLHLQGGRKLAALIGGGGRLVLGELPESVDRPAIVLPVTDAEALAALVAGIGEVMDRDEPCGGVTVGLGADRYLTVAFTPTMAVGLHVGDQEPTGMVTFRPVELPRVAAWFVDVARLVRVPGPTVH